MTQLLEIAEILSKTSDRKEIEKFLSELLTSSEIDAISKRWRILDLLSKGETQRSIVKNLNVSLCNVTRGAKILKNKNSVSAKFIKSEE